MSYFIIESYFILWIIYTYTIYRKYILSKYILAICHLWMLPNLVRHVRPISSLASYNYQRHREVTIRITSTTITTNIRVLLNKFGPILRRSFSFRACYFSEDWNTDIYNTKCVRWSNANVWNAKVKTLFFYIVPYKWHSSQRTEEL